MTFIQAYQTRDTPTIYNALEPLSITWQFLYVKAWKEVIRTYDPGSYALSLYQEFASYTKLHQKRFFYDIVKFQNAINPNPEHIHFTKIKTIPYLHTPFNSIVQELRNVQNTQKT